MLLELYGTVMTMFLSVDGMVAFAASIAALTGLGSAMAMAIMTSKAVDAIARQPEAAGQIRGSLTFALIFAETTAVYGVLVALLILIF